MLKEPEKSEPKIERRKYSRIPIETKFYCRHAEPDEGNGQLIFYSKDLDCGGVFLKCKTIAFVPGKILHMYFNLPGHDQTITVKGVIVRKDDEGVGIMFLTLEINEFELLKNFMRSHLNYSELEKN